MTTSEWKAMERMVKGKDPMVIRTKDGKVSLEYIRSGTMEYFYLNLPYDTAALYESSPIPKQYRKHLRIMYNSWYSIEIDNLPF